MQGKLRHAGKPAYFGKPALCDIWGAEPTHMKSLSSVVQGKRVYGADSQSRSFGTWRTSCLSEARGGPVREETGRGGSHTRTKHRLVGRHDGITVSSRARTLPLAQVLTMTKLFPERVAAPQPFSNGTSVIPRPVTAKNMLSKNAREPLPMSPPTSRRQMRSSRR